MSTSLFLNDYELLVCYHCKTVATQNLLCITKLNPILTDNNKKSEIKMN